VAFGTTRYRRVSFEPLAEGQHLHVLSTHSGATEPSFGSQLAIVWRQRRHGVSLAFMTPALAREDDATPFPFPDIFDEAATTVWCARGGGYERGARQWGWGCDLPDGGGGGVVEEEKKEGGRGRNEVSYIPFRRRG
jgi:hypothetical protein